MPLYEFKCGGCGHKEEDLFKDYNRAISAPPLCENCHEQMDIQYPRPSVKVVGNMNDIPMTSPQWVEQRRKQCGIEV